MKRETKSNLRTKVFAVFATVVIFSANTLTFAQSATYNNHSAFNQLFAASTNTNFWLNENLIQDDEKYPMPDFSPLSPWYEVKKAEYDLYASPPVLKLVFVIKKESRPWVFDMRFEDADGVLVKINTGFCAYYMAPSGNELNTPIKCDVWVADRKEMKRVKTVRIVKKD